MNKIFRWTIGNASKIGLEILRESIIQAKKNLSDFDFYVCSNSDSEKVHDLCKRQKVKHLIQTKNINLPFETIGSFWKLSPARIDLSSYEIICDNDLILAKRLDEINYFLKSDVPLICEENLFCFGKFSKFIDRPYNSGIYGLPPGFDFEARLIKKWIEKKSMVPLNSYNDEQGLIILTLLDFSPIKISIDNVCYMFNEGEPIEAKYVVLFENEFETKKIQKIKYKNPEIINKKLFHFISANRNENHKFWKQYRIKFI
jgi:hypothetical protein